LETYNREYERRHFRFNATNRRVGTATRELFVSWFPRLAAPLVRSAIHAMLDDPLIEAFGFPRPPPLIRSNRRYLEFLSALEDTSGGERDLAKLSEPKRESERTIRAYPVVTDTRYR
jgi:hypothetical protein